MCTGGGTGDSHSLLCNTFVFLAVASKDLHHMYTVSYKSLHPHKHRVHAHYMNTKAVFLFIGTYVTVVINPRDA